MAAPTKTPVKTTKTRNVTAKNPLQVVDELPEGKSPGRGPSSKYLGIAKRIANENSGKWVLVMTSENRQGAGSARKNLLKREAAGELPGGEWDIVVKLFDGNTQFPGDENIQSALYMKHTA